MNLIKYFSLISCCFVFFSSYGQGSLIIEEGATVQVTGPNSIVIQNGSFENNGTFTATDGTVVMEGDAASATTVIKGTTPTTFHNLTINKTENDVLLEQDVIVNNTLDFQGGHLDLQTNDLIIQIGGTIINATLDKYVRTSDIGTLTQEVTATNAVIFPVGNSSYNPTSLENSGTIDNYSVRVVDEVLEGGASGAVIANDVVNRTWKIDEATNGGSDLSVTVTWSTADEGIGFDRTNAFLSRHTGTIWTQQTATAASGTDPWSISRAGITAPSSFAVFNGIVLPIELLSFQAFAKKNQAKLEWRTASEIDSDYFEVQHSTDGFSFKKIGEIKAAGQSTVEQYYDFLHRQPVIGDNFYRLKQVDLNGQFKYSDIRQVHFTEKGDVSLSVYPNPATNGLNIQWYGDLDHQTCSMTLVDVAGRGIWRSDLAIMEQGTTYLPFPANLVAGIYWLRLLSNDKVQFIEKVVVSKRH